MRHSLGEDISQNEVSVKFSRESLTFPVLLAVAAPLAVFISIEYLHSVWWTFALYQVSICFVAPAVESRSLGRSGHQHFALLGLVQGSEDLAKARDWRKLAAVLGVATTLVTGSFLVLTRDRFLDPELLDSTLVGWGVPHQQVLTMLVVMAVLNAAAEELFWRGYFPGRVAEARPGAKPPVALTIILPSVLYASYHAATISSLVSETVGVVIMTVGVLSAGLIWGWLRQRTHSVWPSLMSHSGAVLAYLAVHVWITSTGGS